MSSRCADSTNTCACGHVSYIGPDRPGEVSLYISINIPPLSRIYIIEYRIYIIVYINIYKKITRLNVDFKLIFLLICIDAYNMCSFGCGVIAYVFKKK